MLVRSNDAHYHLARILLLVNKPHETIKRPSTVANSLNSYCAIEENVVSHCYEIWYVGEVFTVADLMTTVANGITLSRPEAFVRLHPTQALFVASNIYPRVTRDMLFWTFSVE